MLASGAHVKLGDYEFLIDESVAEHYVKSYERVQSSLNGQIVGEDEKQVAKRHRLLWSLTDWTRGEGTRIFYPDDPARYDKSDGLNGRIPGQLTGRPQRAVNAVNYDDRRNKPFLTAADGKLWLIGSQTVKYCTDISGAFTSKTTALSGSSFVVTAVYGDTQDVYYSGWHSGSSGTRVTYRITASGSEETVQSSGTSRAPFAGMTMLGEYLYGWTGRKLTRLDPSSIPSTGTAVGNSGVEVPTGNSLGNNWFADCFSTEDSVIAWYANDAISRVYSYNQQRGFSLLWQAPYGFTIKSGVYQNGVLWFGGHWGGDENMTGRGALYALPLTTLDPDFIGWFRKHDNKYLQMQEMANSYGKQILVNAARTGRVFVYDDEYRGISILDDISDDSNWDSGTNSKIGSVITWGKYRAVAVYRAGAASAGTQIHLYYWPDDEPENREVSTTGGYSEDLISGEYDFSFPMEKKNLVGFHVFFKALTANQRITVSYSTDGGTSYTATTAITSATSGQGDGRVFVPVITGTSTVAFHRLKVKVTIDTNSTSGITVPILYGVTAEAELANYDRTWRLILRMKDEGQRNASPRNREKLGEQLRDWLWTVAEARDAITFLDGYRYKRKPDLYSTHVVVIDRVVDTIDRKAEGPILVELRERPE